MTTIIIKLRDSIEDNYKYTTDSFEYITSKIFSLTEANIDSSSLVCYKNGTLWLLTPVAGAGVAWARNVTAITVTKTAHGLITGDTITVTASSDTAAVTLATKIVTKLTDNTFTFAGLNAGGSTGTLTYTIVANYAYSSTTGKITVTGTLTAGDVLEFVYNAYIKYSDAELRGYIRAALGDLSIEKYKTFVAKSDNTIYPTPTEDEEYLISFVASVRIKGSISSYKTPEITINFNDKQSREDKIRQAIRQFSKVYGVIKYVELDEKIAPEEEEDE